MTYVGTRHQQIAALILACLRGQTNGRSTPPPSNALRPSTNGG